MPEILHQGVIFVKKIMGLLLALSMILVFTGCENQETDECSVVNAVVTDVDAKAGTLTVKDPGNENIFGEKAVIDCAFASLLYCDYDTGDLMELSLRDFNIQDEVIIQIYLSELEKLQEDNGASSPLKVKQVQLGTQRLDIDTNKEPSV